MKEKRFKVIKQLVNYPMNLTCSLTLTEIMNFVLNNFIAIEKQNGMIQLYLTKKEIEKKKDSKDKVARFIHVNLPIPINIISLKYELLNHSKDEKFYAFRFKIIEKYTNDILNYTNNGSIIRLMIKK